MKDLALTLGVILLVAVVLILSALKAMRGRPGQKIHANDYVLRHRIGSTPLADGGRADTFMRRVKGVDWYDVEYLDQHGVFLRSTPLSQTKPTINVGTYTNPQGTDPKGPKVA